MRGARRVTVLIALLLVPGLLIASRWLGGSGSDVDTALAVREEFRAVVTATGKLEAAVAFEVGPPSVPEIWSYNLSWMIPEGSRVNEGDVIARFDPTEMDDRLRNHNAELETTLQEREKEERNLQVELKRLHLDLVKAQGELKELDLDLQVPDSLVPELELEQSRLRRDLARRRADFLTEKIDHEQELVKTKLELLDVKRAFAESKINYYTAAKAKFTVQAPVSGVVVYVMKQNGDRWEVGESVWMLAKILQIADISTLQVEANVLEVDAARIEPGQLAEIAVDALPGLKLKSSVLEIGRIVHERSLQDSSKVFDAILPMEGEGLEALRPGMGVHVSIETTRLRDQLTIPLEAVRVANEGTYVQVVVGDKVERRPVELGERNDKRVIVESGLAEGERVKLTVGEGA